MQNNVFFYVKLLKCPFEKKNQLKKCSPKRRRSKGGKKHNNNGLEVSSEPPHRLGVAT